MPKKNNYLKTICAVVFFFPATGCSSKAGWTQSDRDKLISGCKQKAMAERTAKGQNFSAEGEKRLNEYCTCYQQRIEKKYVTIKELEKASISELTEAAYGCIQLMVK